MKKFFTRIFEGLTSQRFDLHVSSHDETLRTTAIDTLQTLGPHRRIDRDAAHVTLVGVVTRERAIHEAFGRLPDTVHASYERSRDEVCENEKIIHVE